MGLTTDLRALSVTGLEYYNLDALGRKGTSQGSGRGAIQQGLPSLTIVDELMVNDNENENERRTGKIDERDSYEVVLGFGNLIRGGVWGHSE